MRSIGEQRGASGEILDRIARETLEANNVNGRRRGQRIDDGRFSKERPGVGRRSVARVVYDTIFALRDDGFALTGLCFGLERSEARRRSVSVVSQWTHF